MRQYHQELFGFIHKQDLLPSSISNSSNNAHESELYKKMNKIVEYWNGLDFVSFCTAFEMKGGQTTLTLGGITEPQNPSELYDAFLTVTRHVSNDCGERPWEMMRKAPHKRNESYMSQFPAVLLNLSADNNLNDLGCEVRHCPSKSIKEVLADIGDVENKFQNSVDKEALSWNFYALYPCLLGDEIRKRSTSYALYILGTSLNLVDYGEKDYGLIIGLTQEILSTADELKKCVSNICYVWHNSISLKYLGAVRERMTTLWANQDIKHVIVNYTAYVWGSKILPTLRNSSIADETIEEIQKYVLSISAKSMLSELSQEIMNHKKILSKNHRKFIENEEYDLARYVCQHLAEALDVSMTNCVELTVQYLKKEFVIAIISSYIRDTDLHGNGMCDDGLTATICNKNDDRELSIEIKNFLKKRSNQPRDYQSQLFEPRKLEALKQLGINVSRQYNHELFKTTIIFNTSYFGRLIEN